MKKIVLAVAIVVIAVAAWIAFGGKNSNNNSTGNNSNSPSHSSQPAAQPVAADKVTIQNFAFSPAAITVKKGTTVTWTNQDDTSHTVTENDGKNGPSAPPLGQGQGYSFTFNQTGTFHYHCSIHQEMTGTVTVTD